MTNNLSGHSSDNGSLGDVTGHNRAGCNDRIISNVARS